VRCPSTRTCPHRHVVVFETKEDRGDVPEHQNKPTRARSGVRDEGKGEGEGKGGGRWRKGQRDHPDTKDGTTGLRPLCLGGRKGKGNSRHEEHDLVVVFFMSGW